MVELGIHGELGNEMKVELFMSVVA